MRRSLLTGDASVQGRSLDVPHSMKDLPPGPSSRPAKKGLLNVTGADYA